MGANGLSEGITNSTNRLSITVEGQAADGRLALSEVARIAGEFQAQLERIARVLIGSSASSRGGRTPSEIVEATRLDLVGFRHGSAVLEIEPVQAEPTLIPSLLDECLDAFFAGARELGDNPARLPHGFDRSVVTGFRTLTGSVGAAITRIRITQEGREPLVMDDAVKQAVRRHLRAAQTEDVAISGRLHMGDFAPSALRCRIDTAHGSVMCDFDLDLRDEVLAAMDQLVSARGQAERWQGATEPKILHLEAVEPIREERARSIADLAAEQGVQPLSSIADLTGEPVDDFDEYLAAIRSTRSA